MREDRTPGTFATLAALLLIVALFAYYLSTLPTP